MVDLGLSVLLEVEGLETAVISTNLAFVKFMNENKTFHVDELHLCGVVSLSFSLFPEIRRQLKLIKGWLRIRTSGKRKQSQNKEQEQEKCVEDSGLSVLEEVEKLEKAVMRTHLVLLEFMQDNKANRRKFEVDELPACGVVSLASSLLPEVTRQLVLVKDWLKATKQQPQTPTVPPPAPLPTSSPPSIQKESEEDAIMQLLNNLEYGGDPLGLDKPRPPPTRKSLRSHAQTEQGKARKRPMYVEPEEDGEEKEEPVSSSKRQGQTVDSTEEDDKSEVDLAPVRNNKVKKNKKQPSKSSGKRPGPKCSKGKATTSSKKRTSTGSLEARTCPKCHKVFKYRADKARHLQTPPCGKRVWYICPHCGRTMARLDNLNLHLSKYCKEKNKGTTKTKSSES